MRCDELRKRRFVEISHGQGGTCEGGAHGGQYVGRNGSNDNAKGNEDAKMIEA